jgi:methylenetetrahydrofolate reductase (NADPH)
MEYVCPQTCPKNMRNGPCGGTKNGECEVVDKPCIWTSVFERAKSAGRVEDLKVYIPPPTRALKGTSSWINFFLGRDSRPGNISPLVPAIDSNAQHKTSGVEATSSRTTRMPESDAEVPIGKIDAHRH